MKWVALSTILFFISCSNKAVDQIFTHYKKQDIEFAATIPGWAIRAGLRVAKNYSEDDTFKDINKIIEKIYKVRLLVTDKNTIKDSYQFVHSNLTKDRFELYGKVKSNQTYFDLWVKEKNDKIQDIFLYVNDNTDLVLVQIKGRINLKALEPMLEDNLYSNF